jgi:hypothetical protein
MKHIWATLVVICFVWLYLRSPAPAPATAAAAAGLLGPLKSLTEMLAQDLWLALVSGSVLTGLIWAVSKFFSGWK